MSADKNKELLERIKILEKDKAYLIDLLNQYKLSYTLPSSVNFTELSKEILQTKRLFNIENITEEKVKLFAKLFQGRTDVYARLVTLKTGKAYLPVCENFWKYNICPKAERKSVKCQECSNKKWKPLSLQTLRAHLEGKSDKFNDVVGIYPIKEDGTSNFLVFDFDNHNPGSQSNNSNKWKEEVNALRNICQANNVDVLVECSRSGKGAHVWLFFEEPITAALARQFGTLLLTKGAETVNQKDFTSYDRMIPSQDFVQPGGLGNLIALPLQGKALCDGNSAFVDTNWKPYPNQWDKLKSVIKISKTFIEEKIKQWNVNGPLGVLAKTTTESDSDYIKPWEKKNIIWNKLHVQGNVKITQANMLFIDTSNIKPPLQNQIRRLAAFSNPEFYKKQAMGFSTLGTPRIIFCGYDQDNYICIPRGCYEELIHKLEETNIPYDVEDKRQNNYTIDVTFQGELYPEQKEAADKMLSCENGVLEAATAFGKTAVGAYLIAKRKLNTLILVHNKEILKNWQEDLNKFLNIQEELPQYQTLTGRVKTYSSAIGVIAGGQCKNTGIIDIAMIGSLGKQDYIKELVKEYGLVIMDECHHAGAVTAMNVLSEINAKYVYGLTATPKRNDGQEQKIFMQLGPVRYRYTTKNRLMNQQVSHYIYPRFTRLSQPNEDRLKINEAYKLVVTDEVRNGQIISDVQKCLLKGHTPLVLTRFKEHAHYLYEQLKNKADFAFLLQGGGSIREKHEIREKMRLVPNEKTMVVIATGQYVGEGFNFPRFDTLMITTPISWQGNVEQYAGRLHRDYEGKKEVCIYDYVDSHIGILETMYHRRLRTYKRMGYQVLSDAGNNEQTNCIFDRNSYADVFYKDLCKAEQEIVISSPRVSEYQVKKLLQIVQNLKEKNVKVSIITLNAEIYSISRTEKVKALFDLLRCAGVTLNLKETMHKHYAIIDNNLIWYGSMNLLAYAREDDNLIRLTSPIVAQELLEK